MRSSQQNEAQSEFQINTFYYTMEDMENFHQLLKNGVATMLCLQQCSAHHTL